MKQKLKLVFNWIETGRKATYKIHKIHQAENKLFYICKNLKSSIRRKVFTDLKIYYILFVIFQVLIVFGKEDSQSDAFCRAAEKGNYKCNLARNAETALDSYLDKQHDVVVIDHRHRTFFDAEMLCRYAAILKVAENAILSQKKSTYISACSHKVILLTVADPSL